MIKIPVGGTFTFEDTKCIRIDEDTVIVTAVTTTLRSR